MPHLSIPTTWPWARSGLSTVSLTRTVASGSFYAGAAKQLTGAFVDQSDIVPGLANPTFQDHATEAIHRFIRT
jgi:hypothetical protein